MTHPEQGVKPAWISVRERLPEDSDLILAWRGIAVVPAHYWVASGLPSLLVEKVGFYSIAEGDEFMHGVTHWMPLPDPPEGA